MAVEKGGLRVVPLETLLELKIASGLSAEHRRLVDLADVQRTIEALKLPMELGESLHPGVRAEYGRLWALAQRAGEGPVER